MTAARHLSVSISRPAEVVYDYVSNPENLPRWASGLAGTIELRDGEWISDSPMGRITIRFAERNPFGVADHVVTIATGETFVNPMRVLPDGDGSELVFTLRRADGVTDEDYERDAATISGDLDEVRRILERA